MNRPANWRIIRAIHSVEPPKPSAMTVYWIYTTAVLAMLLGIKFYLIAMLATPLPFWDQWDAEGLKLLDPYLGGNLHVVDLFASHNEHRILFTRIVTVMLTEIFGSWNNLPEAMLCATLQTCFLYALAFYFRREMAARPLILGLVFGCLLIIPGNMENFLIGFQSQFFFGMTFSIVAVALLSGRKLASIGWWLGMAASVCAQLSIASGFIAPMAAAVAIALRALASRESRTERIVQVAILVPTVIGMLYMIERPAGSATMQSHGVVDFVHALAQTTGWPVPIPFVAPLILNAPIILLCASAILTRSCNASTWRVIAIALWILASVAAIAYSRGAAPIQSRYLDLLSLTAIVNVVALVVLIDANPWSVDPARQTMVVAGWLAIVLGSSVIANTRMLPRLVFADAQAAIDRTRNVETFIATGDRTSLDKPILHIPYPDPDRLAMILKRPMIRGLIPAEFGASEAERAAVQRALVFKGGLRTTTARFRMIASLLGVGLMALGLALCSIPIATMITRRRELATRRLAA